MQNVQPIEPPRFLGLNAGAMAVAFAVLAFLRGLFAIPIIALVHHHIMSRIEAPMGSQNGEAPSGPMASPMGGATWTHHFGHGHSAFILVMIWLATIVAAAIGGALLAIVYNAVAARSASPRPVA